jgi:AcrR family transcriptional regulator
VSRRADPELETRVLMAARKLWAKGGERSLTMRAVARAAGTNTPAVYRRFKDRRDLLRALMQKTQSEVSALLQRCNSLQEICHCIFDYALSHPREYELLASKMVWTSQLPRYNFGHVVKKAAEWLGGSEEDCQPLVIALWSLIHGSALLLIAEVLPEHATTVRAAFTVAVEELVRNHRQFAKLR